MLLLFYVRLRLYIDLNASMRRIDLLCKLVAPVVISLVDGLSTKVAVWTVLGVNVLCVFIEYIAIAQVSSSIFRLYTVWS